MPQAPTASPALPERIGGLLGREFTDGGVHPRFGTRNMILPLADHTYLEIVEVLDHPASDKAPVRPGRAGPVRGGRRLAGLGRRRRRPRPDREAARP